MATNGYREAERRLVILRITNEGDGVANDRLLRNGLQHWGLGVGGRRGLAQTHKTLDWLEEQRLVNSTSLPTAEGSPVRRVTITPLGRDVATGVKDVDGVTPRGSVAD